MAAPPRPTRAFSGAVAIVTGAGAQGEGIGNGRATAVLLADAGTRVVCVDLDLGDALRTVDMVLEGGGTGIAVRADVSVEEECARVVRRAVEEYGRVDVLVNNVGIGGARGTAVEVDVAEWARGLEVNVTSMMLMAKYAIPEMKKNRLGHETEGRDGLWAGRSWRGSVVNMGSVAGLRGGTPHLLYPTAKGAVVNMTRAMAAQHAPDGVRVNCVCPGMLYTPMMYGGGMTDEAREARRNRSLLKTEGNGWDAGAAIRFLASDEARWITGTILTVDAGASCATSSDIPQSASVGAPRAG